MRSRSFEQRSRRKSNLPRTASFSERQPKKSTLSKTSELASTEIPEKYLKEYANSPGTSQSLLVEDTKDKEIQQTTHPDVLTNETKFESVGMHENTERVLAANTNVESTTTTESVSFTSFTVEPTEKENNVTRQVSGPVAEETKGTMSLLAEEATDHSAAPSLHVDSYLTASLSPLPQVVILQRPKEQHQGRSEEKFPSVGEQVDKPQNTAVVTESSTAATQPIQEAAVPATTATSLLNTSAHSTTMRENDFGMILEKIIDVQNIKIFEMLEKERRERERMDAERQQQLLNNMNNLITVNLPKLLDKTIYKQLKALFTNVTKNFAQTLDTTLNKHLENFKKWMLQSLPLKFDATVKEGMDKYFQSRQIIQTLSEAVEQNVRVPIQETFRQYFQDILAPAFEASLRKMFEQLNETFESGLKEYEEQLRSAMATPLTMTQNNTNSQQNNNNLPPTNAELPPPQPPAQQQQQQQLFTELVAATTEQLKAAVQILLNVAESMNRSIIETQNKILADYTERITRLSSIPSVAPSEMSPSGEALTSTLMKKAQKRSIKEMKFDVEQMVKNEMFEDAFTTVLRANDLEMVRWLCSLVSPQKIFGKSPLPISQVVLISLIQQLSCEMNKATSLKLTWLRECLLALNPNDPTISEHVRPILTSLLETMEELAPAYSDPSHPHSSSFRTLSHIINSLLYSSQTLE
jgi:hypothetical protein